MSRAVTHTFGVRDKLDRQAVFRRRIPFDSSSLIAEISIYRGGIWRVLTSVPASRIHVGEAHIMEELPSWQQDAIVRMLVRGKMNATLPLWMDENEACDPEKRTLILQWDRNLKNLYCVGGSVES